MARYSVMVTKSVTFDVSVHAETEEEAMEQAELEAAHITDGDAVEVAYEISSIVEEKD